MATTNSIAKTFDRLREEPGGKGLLENALLISMVTLASTAGMGSLALYVTHACTMMGHILAKLVF